MQKTRILIAGIGGVGGYFGGLLARRYADQRDVEVHFLARGSHLTEIQNNGLCVRKGTVEFIARPASATDDPSSIGLVDYIILCTKSYDLEAIIPQLLPCISSHTVILPLLNGVDNRARIKRLLPDALVLDGCVYLVSRLVQPGVVENNGNIEKLYFGLDGSPDAAFSMLGNILREAGIDVTYSQNISGIIWEKFIFISAFATATSYFDNTIGEIFEDPEKVNFLTDLIAEVIRIAQAKEISVDHGMLEKTLQKARALNHAATSSLHADFKRKSPRNELDALTGYVVAAGDAHDIATPAFDTAYRALVMRMS
jgi:2-dehydropantoate 2-reductase